MSGKECPQGLMRKGFFLDLKQCEVSTMVYDIAIWADLAGWGLLWIWSTLIFIGLAVWFRCELFAELRKKRRYSSPLGAMWLASSCGVGFLILDRQGIFVGHDGLATVLFTLSIYFFVCVCHFCGMNTRDTAAAMDDKMKAKMQKVGRVFNVVFMLETLATIIAIILDNGMIALIYAMIHCGVCEPIHVVVCGRMKLSVFEFLGGVKNPEKRKEFVMRKRRFQHIQVFVVAVAIVCNVLMVMIATKLIPAFYYCFPFSLISLLGCFMCPILARRLFKVSAKVAPKNALLQMVLVQSGGDRQNCSSGGLSSEEEKKSDEVCENNEEKRNDSHRPEQINTSAQATTFRQSSKELENGCDSQSKNDENDRIEVSQKDMQAQAENDDLNDDQRTCFDDFGQRERKEQETNNQPQQTTQATNHQQTSKVVAVE